MFKNQDRRGPSTLTILLTVHFVYPLDHPTFNSTDNFDFHDFKTDKSMLEQCKAFIKSEIRMIPFLGWAMWLNEFGFLTRAKASKDLKTLQRASEHFRGES